MQQWTQGVAYKRRWSECNEELCSMMGHEIRAQDHETTNNKNLHQLHHLKAQTDLRGNGCVGGKGSQADIRALGVTNVVQLRCSRGGEHECQLGGNVAGAKWSNYSKMSMLSDCGTNYWINWS